MATVQSNLTLGQLGRCFARIARESGELEVNIRAARLGDVRYKKDTATYALEVLPYGLLICRTGTSPVPEDMRWQTNPAFLRAARKAAGQWADARKVKWPSGRFDARRDFGLSGWPPNPAEFEADRLKRRVARGPVPAPEEQPVPDEQLRSGQHVAQASEEAPLPTSGEEASQQPSPTATPDDLGYGPIIMAIDLVEGRFRRDGDLFIPLAA